VQKILFIKILLLATTTSIAHPRSHNNISKNHSHVVDVAATAEDSTKVSKEYNATHCSPYNRKRRKNKKFSF
jgi:hypothetical protein